MHDALVIGSVLGAIVLLALVVIFIASRRDRNVKAIRVGVFYEKEREVPERWPGEDTRIDSAGSETLARWPKKEDG